MLPIPSSNSSNICNPARPQLDTRKATFEGKAVQDSGWLRSTRRVAVEGEQVDGPAGDAGQGAGDGAAGYVRAQLSGGLFAQEGEQVGTQAGDVRGGHRGAGDGVLRNMSLVSWTFLSVLFFPLGETKHTAEGKTAGEG